MNMEEIFYNLSSSPAVVVAPPAGLPKLDNEGLILPEDVAAFYTLCGGLVVSKGDSYEIEIVGPSDFVRVNPIIVGEECRDDITWDWFIIARSGEQIVSIDLGASRVGRVYDSFWDRHGVAGSCPIIASSLTQFLERMWQVGVGPWYWAVQDFEPLGDAYDDI